MILLILMCVILLIMCEILICNINNIINNY